MKRLIFALAMLPGAAIAQDFAGMPTRITCATYLDIANGDIPSTNAMNAYMQGLLDGVALAAGANSQRMRNAGAALVAACEEDKLAPLSRVIATLEASDFN